MSSALGVAGDTSSVVVEKVVEWWRGMSAGEKLDQVVELNRTCERLSEAGVRARYPEAGGDEVRLRVLALRLGRDVMVEVYGWDPTVEGW
ncbi:MAG: hypothetical protein R8G01_21840 [Ilumatobacteraceae bacterium]|nr:hypothetical protein [Ilumatobacteraceae bacterium]